MPEIRTKISRVPFLHIILELSLCVATISASHHRHFKTQEQEVIPLPLAQVMYETKYMSNREHPPPASRVSRSLPQDQNCPTRNAHDVAVAGMTCVRRCSEDKDCTNDRKLCLCDGLCGLSCIRPEKECPELPDPEQGQVQLDGRHFQVLRIL